MTVLCSRIKVWQVMHYWCFFFSLTKTAFEMSRGEIAMGIIWNISTGVCYISKWQQEVKHCSDGLNWKVSALVVLVLFCFFPFLLLMTSSCLSNFPILGHVASDHLKFINALFSEACTSLKPPRDDNLISSSLAPGREWPATLLIINRS